MKLKITKKTKEKMTIKMFEIIEKLHKYLDNDYDYFNTTTKEDLPDNKALDGVFEVFIRDEYDNGEIIYNFKISWVYVVDINFTPFKEELDKLGFELQFIDISDKKLNLYLDYVGKQK